jgi:hypothetical protein
VTPVMALAPAPVGLLEANRTTDIKAFASADFLARGQELVIQRGTGRDCQWRWGGRVGLSSFS